MNEDLNIKKCLSCNKEINNGTPFCSNKCEKDELLVNINNIDFDNVDKYNDDYFDSFESLNEIYEAF